MNNRFLTLGEVLAEEVFVEVDLRLREGGHIDDGDIDLFVFLEDARAHLEALYKRFGCDLVRAVDRYYYLLPHGTRFGQRRLSAAEMLVGQVLSLLSLDPDTLRTSGRIERQRVLELLDQLVGPERLGRALNPRRKKRSASVEAKEIRKDVDRAISTLCRLGFVRIDGDKLLLRRSLLRFAEPVEGRARPQQDLANLISSGELADPLDDDEDTREKDDENGNELDDEDEQG